MSRLDPPAPFHPAATRRIRSSVRVGVGVLVCRGDKVYAGTRKGSHGAGRLALPGGHLEMFESWEECAIREIKEEMGLELKNPIFAHVCNNPMPDEDKHYVTIFMMERIEDDVKEPVNLEPDKCDGWRLYSWSHLKEMVGSNMLFSPLESLLCDDPDKLSEYIYRGTVAS